MVPVVVDVSYDAEREKDFKEISENATLDDIKEIADILGVAYQVRCFYPILSAYIFFLQSVNPQRFIGYEFYHRTIAMLPASNSFLKKLQTQQI